MRILLISYFPQVIPTYKDVDYILLNHLKLLGKKFEIIFLCAVRNSHQRGRVISALKNYCYKIYTIEDLVPVSYNFLNGFGIKIWFRGIMNTFRVVLCHSSVKKLIYFPIFFLFSKKFSGSLRKILKAEKPDIVHFYDLCSSVYLKDIPEDTPTVFLPIDSISRYFYSNFTVSKGIAGKLYNYFRYAGTRAWEDFIMKRFSVNVVVASQDEHWLSKINPKLKLKTAPIGVDADFFRPCGIKEDYPSVVFFGIMSLKCNIDAVLSIGKNILPSIRKEFPSLKFYIVGKDPDSSLSLLSRDPLNIITGYVDDTREYIARSSLCIANISSGSGVKLKVLLGMSMAKTVIATPNAVEGIEGVGDEEEIMIANTDEEFSRKAIFLLRNRQERERIGKNARDFIIQNHSWGSWGDFFSELYINLNRGLGC